MKSNLPQSRHRAAYPVAGDGVGAVQQLTSSIQSWFFRAPQPCCDCAQLVKKQQSGQAQLCRGARRACNLWLLWPGSGWWTCASGLSFLSGSLCSSNMAFFKSKTSKSIITKCFKLPHQQIDHRYTSSVKTPGLAYIPTESEAWEFPAGLDHLPHLPGCWGMVTHAKRYRQDL